MSTYMGFVWSFEDLEISVVSLLQRTFTSQKLPQSISNTSSMRSSLRDVTRNIELLELKI